MKKIVIALLAASVLGGVCSAGCGGAKVTYTLSEDGGKHYTVSCSGVIGLKGEYEIPAYYGEGDNYAPVTKIAAEGFSGSGFTKIKVPATVTEIGTAAFGFCYYLETVEFAEGIGLESFAHGLFGNCRGLKSISVPDSVTAIEGLAFSGCTSLSSVDMGGVQTVGVRAFDGCTALESISLPSTLVTIGDRAFYRSGLKSVDIPQSVKDTVYINSDGKEATRKGLGFGAFELCTSLESASIGGGIKTLPSAAFGYCVSLKEVRVPLSVTEVQGAYYEDGAFRYGHAFYGNTALTDVYYAGDEQQWKDIAIEIKTAFENNIAMNNDALKNAQKHYNCKN